MPWRMRDGACARMPNRVSPRVRVPVVSGPIYSVAGSTCSVLATPSRPSPTRSYQLVSRHVRSKMYLVLKTRHNERLRTCATLSPERTLVLVVLDDGTRQPQDNRPQRWAAVRTICDGPIKPSRPPKNKTKLTIGQTVGISTSVCDGGSRGDNHGDNCVGITGRPRTLATTVQAASVRRTQRRIAAAARITAARATSVRYAPLC